MRLGIRISTTSKNSTAICSHHFKSHGYHTYWQEHRINRIPFGVLWWFHSRKKKKQNTHIYIYIYIYIGLRPSCDLMVMLCLWQVDVDFTMQRYGFNPTEVHVGFLVDKWKQRIFSSVTFFCEIYNFTSVSFSLSPSN
jgi:hypothetical protein